MHRLQSRVSLCIRSGTLPVNVNIISVRCCDEAKRSRTCQRRPKGSLHQRCVIEDSLRRTIPWSVRKLLEFCRRHLLLFGENALKVPVGARKHERVLLNGRPDRYFPASVRSRKGFARMIRPAKRQVGGSDCLGGSLLSRRAHLRSGNLPCRGCHPLGGTTRNIAMSGFSRKRSLTHAANGRENSVLLG